MLYYEKRLLGLPLLLRGVGSVLPRAVFPALTGAGLSLLFELATTVPRAYFDGRAAEAEDDEKVGVRGENRTRRRETGDPGDVRTSRRRRILNTKSYLAPRWYYRDGQSAWIPNHLSHHDTVLVA